MLEEPELLPELPEVPEELELPDEPELLLLSSELPVPELLLPGELLPPELLLLPPGVSAAPVAEPPLDRPK